MSPDDLHPDDVTLWQQVQQSVQPIRRRYHSDAPVRAKKIPCHTHAGAMRFPVATEHLPGAGTPLKQGAGEGIDRRTATRFTRGKMNIDATLDLHGMQAHVAYQRVQQFIQIQYARQRRCLLVITGKGMRSGETGQKSGGVLREALPQWLAQEEIRPLVLAYEQAQPQHGGSGAYYVLLRRKRS